MHHLKRKPKWPQIPPRPEPPQLRPDDTVKVYHPAYGESFACVVQCEGLVLTIRFYGRMLTLVWDEELHRVGGIGAHWATIVGGPGDGVLRAFEVKR